MEFEFPSQKNNKIKNDDTAAIVHIFLFFKMRIKQFLDIFVETASNLRLNNI